MPARIVQKGSFSDDVYQVIRAHVGGITAEELMADPSLHMGNQWEAGLVLKTLLEAELVVFDGSRYFAAIPVV